MQPINYALPRIEACRANNSTFLDLGNCGLEKIPPEVAHLTWLEDLNLGGVFWDENGLTFKESANNGPANFLASEDFSVLESLPNLKKLSMRGCSLKELTPLKKLLQVRSLTLGENDLDNIEPLASLVNLEALSLFDNKISSIGPLAVLSNLQMLSVNYNRLTDIRGVEKLSHLKELHLAGNQIVDIEPVSGLLALERINLSSNLIKTIRPLAGLPSLTSLRLDGNPVEDCPPELALTGDLERIRSFFLSLEKNMPEFSGSAAPEPEEDVLPVPEVKLILVGNPTAGKTSLSKILRGLEFDAKESTTHGIQIHEWLVSASDLKDLPGGNTLSEGGLRVNIWDFGGQEYYHGTHQIFLDSNAVYVLMWDSEHNLNTTTETNVFVDGRQSVLMLDHFHFHYWLDNIRFYASGTTTGSKPPLFVLQNKTDLNGGKVQWLEPRLMENYSVTNVSGISAKLATSRKAAHKRYRYGFDIFKEDLLLALVEKAKNNAQLEYLPPVWVHARRHLRALRNGIQKGNPFAPYLKENAWIAFEDFEKACNSMSAALSQPEIQTLAFYLDRIGAVVWLPQVDRKVYVNPAWLTEKIYKVLNDRVRSQWGRFTGKDVESYLGGPADSELMLRLMKVWEIIFQEGNTPDAWVAPQYLPEEHPMENLFRIALTGLQDQFFMIRAPLFHYRKMLRRIIFRYGNDPTVANKEFWKNGILFVTHETGLRVFIKGSSDPGEQDGRIMICVEKNKTDSEIWKQRVFTDLLAIFLERGQRLNEDSRSWVHLPAALRAEVMVQQDIRIAPDNKNFITLPALVDAARNGLSAIVTPEGHRLRLQEFAPLLAGLQLTPPLPSIFFSYSHEDKSLRDALDKHLAPLRRLGRALSWYDGEIGAGQNWEDSIRRNLKSADIILLLISPDFINSSFIWENELLPALERHNNGECRVIPVLIRPCLWQELPFARLQMVPHTPETGRLSAVSLWKDPDEAFAYIAENIALAVAELGIVR